MYDDVNFDTSTSSKPRELHPKGIIKAATVDIIDMPHQVNPFYDPDKKGSMPFTDQVKLVWETAARRSDGSPFKISRTFTKSLYDGSRGGAASALHKILDSWLGSEYDGRFVARKINGRPAILVIRHEVKGDRTVAKIDNVMPDEGENTYTPSGSYKRYIPKETKPEPKDEEETPF